MTESELHSCGPCFQYPPNPHQYEGLRAMYFAANVTGENFACYWPRSCGLTTMIFTFLYTQLFLGRAPSRVVVVSSSLNHANGHWGKFGGDHPLPPGVNICKGVRGSPNRIRLIQQTRLDKMHKELADALPKFSLDLVKLVGEYTDDCECVIRFLDLSQFSNEKELPNLVIVDGIVSACNFHHQLIPGWCLGMQIFLFTRDYPFNLPDRLAFLPELRIPSSVGWHKRIAEQDMGFIPRPRATGGVYFPPPDIMSRMLAKGYDPTVYQKENDLLRSRLKCSTM